MDAIDIPAEFPYDRAERRIDYGRVKIGSADYQMPVNAYWFGCSPEGYIPLLDESNRLSRL